MRIACVQMDMRPGDTAYNAAHAEELIRRAVENEHPDTVVLPETWNTGFFPADAANRADTDGVQTRAQFSALAKELSVNIVAGSVANLRGGKLYNTAYVFDRSGACVGVYDKTHLFTPMGEDKTFTAGNTLCRFTLDGVSCAVIICYDVRFPELVRTLALKGLDMLFVVSQWPDKRMRHLTTLTHARAIENQMFVTLCNSCGRMGETQYGGGSAIIDPWGETLAEAGTQETILAADVDMTVLADIRASIPVFRDRRPELYDCER